MGFGGEREWLYVDPHIILIAPPLPNDKGSLLGALFHFGGVGSGGGPCSTKRVSVLDAGLPGAPKG